MAADVAAGVTGRIPTLLSLLASSDSTVQQAAASAVADLSGDVTSTGGASAIVAAGGVPRIVCCVREGSTLPARVHSAAALDGICRNHPEARSAVAAAGGAAALTPLLDSLETAQSTAATALGFLARDCSEAQQALVAAGALPVLIRLLSSQHAATRSAAAFTLLEMRRHLSAYLQQLADSAPSLVCLLTSGIYHEEGNAIRLLAQLWEQGGQRGRRTIAAAGAAAALEGFLFNPNREAADEPFLRRAAALVRSIARLPAE